MARPTFSHKFIIKTSHSPFFWPQWTDWKQLKTSFLSIPSIHYYQHMNKGIVTVVNCHLKSVSFCRLHLSSEKRGGAE